MRKKKKRGDGEGERGRVGGVSREAVHGSRASRAHPACASRGSRGRGSAAPAREIAASRRGRGGVSGVREGTALGNRGEGRRRPREDAPRSRRAPPLDAPRCRPPRPRATSRARPRRAESRARRGARPRRASSSRRGVTVTSPREGLCAESYDGPRHRIDPGPRPRSQPRVPPRAAGETDGFYAFRKPRTRRTRRNARGGRPEANVGTFREEIVFALSERRARVSPEVAGRLTSSSRRA